MDIFTQPHTPNEDDALLSAMHARHQLDTYIITQQGRIPDWQGEPSPLDKDMGRVLHYMYENGGMTWTNHASANNRRMVASLGFHQPANTLAAINKCIKAGLVDIEGDTHYLNDRGEYALDEWFIECEVANLDVCELIKANNDTWDVDDEFAKLWG